MRYSKRRINAQPTNPWDPQMGVGLDLYFIVVRRHVSITCFVHDAGMRL